MLFILQNICEKIKTIKVILDQKEILVLVKYDSYTKETDFFFLLQSRFNYKLALFSKFRY